jgi:hypothetical protein
MNELIESRDPRSKVLGKRRMPKTGSESLAADRIFLQRLLEDRGQWPVD